MSRGHWQRLSLLRNCFMVFILLFTTNKGSTWKGSPLLNHLYAQGKVTPEEVFYFLWPIIEFSLKTIMRAPNHIFPSLMNNTHIVGPTSKITCAFDHFSTQLTIVGFKVRMLKCKLWSPSRTFSGI